MSDLNATPAPAAAEAPAPVTAPSEPSAPESTADIARDIIADAEAADANGAGDDGGSAPEATATPETPEPVVAPKADDDADDDDDDIPERNADGKINRIPPARVRQMVQKARAKEAKVWEARVAEHTQKVAAFEQEFQHMAAVEQMMQTNPEAFLQSLVQINPAYARYLQGGGTVPQSQHQSAPAGAGMPEPDYDLPNGQKTYSDKGLQRLMAWQQQEAVRQAEERVSQRYAPIEQQFRAQQIMQQAAPRIQAMVQEARSWPGFTEHEKTVLAVLKTDPNATLQSAYMKVVFPKLQADRNAMRESVLKELKGRPATTSVPASTPATPSTAKTTADIARAIIAQAK